MIHLKCTAVHYGNLNSSAIKQAVFKLRAVEYAISFYRFLIYINEAFAKNYIKDYHFIIQVSNINFTMWYITEDQDVKPCNAKMAAL